MSVSDGVDTIKVSDSVRLRPADSFGAAVLSFSGRCEGLACGAPFTNKAYLHTKGTVQSVANTLASTDVAVRWVSAAAIVSGQRSDNDVLGYYEMQTILDDFEAYSIRGFDNPTRLVLLGHSHGTVWMSLLAYENPDVVFDYAIYLDSVCNQWERDNLVNGDHGNIIARFYNALGESYPQTLRQGACKDGAAGSNRTRHIKDDVPNNVLIGLEVRSKPGVLGPRDITLETQGACNLGKIFNVADQYANRRVGGGVQGLYHYPDYELQDHCEVIDPQGLAMRAVNSFIAENGLPNW